MNEKIMLDQLTENGVSIMTQKYVVSDGVSYDAGPPHRCSFPNSERGRVEIESVLTGQHLTAVMAIWGEVPTVTEQE